MEENKEKIDAINTKEKKDIIYSRNVLKHFEGRLYSVFGNIVIYDEDTGLWSIDCGYTILRKCCVKYANLLFPILNDGDEKKIFDTIFNTCVKTILSL